MQQEAIHPSFLWDLLFIFSLANVHLQDFMIISTLTLKLTIQPDIHQTKLLWIISKFILSQSHHLYSEMSQTAYVELFCPEDFKSCFLEQASCDIANADIEESALHASYYPCACSQDFYFH